MQYLRKVRISASVVVFHCLQTSKKLNEALRTEVHSEWTKLTLLSMRRDPDVNEGMDDNPIPKHINLDEWLIQCRQRIRAMENCVFLWNAGMAVIQE